MAPALWGLIDIPSMLKIGERPKWNFVGYGPDQLVKCGASSLYLRHEPYGKGVGHAKATAESSFVDIAYGHTHTYQTFTHKKIGPVPVYVKAYSLGWLGDKKRSVFDYRGPKDSWVEGITHVECDTESGKYTLDFIDMRVLPVLYRGELYRG